jgi:hypothetical protein
MVGVAVFNRFRLAPRLENIEARNGSRFEAVLLILQLTLKKTNRFLLHPNQSSIEQDQVKLLPHVCYDLIDRIAK